MNRGKKVAVYKNSHPLYATWSGIKARCYCPSVKNFHRYGGRGIKMCSAWRMDFDQFCKDVGERPEGASLDRWPNPDGHYEPGNVRWATKLEQARNKGTSAVIVPPPPILEIYLSFKVLPSEAISIHRASNGKLVDWARTVLLSEAKKAGIDCVAPFNAWFQSDAQGLIDAHYRRIEARERLLAAAQ